MLEFLFIVVLFLTVWYVFDNIRVKEIAVKTCGVLCRQQEYRLLDETVMKQSTRAIRDQTGLLRLQRLYHFQYSMDGLTRLNGTIIMLGQQVVEVHFEHHDYQQTLPA